MKNYWNTHLNKKCLQGKRKAIDANHHDDDNEIMKSNKKKLRRLCHSEAVGSESLTSTTKLELDGRKEESTVTNPRMNEIKNSFYCDMEYPKMPGNNATFVFDDEPLVAYLDSFVLFEAFGCSGEEAYLQMQSIIE